MANTIDAQLPVDIFDVQTNIPLIHQVVVAQLAAARQGTHSTKTRGEVSGGGTVHGPTPRSYDQRTPKKMKAAALRGALSDRARTGRLHVVDSIVPGDVPSTKIAIATLRELTPRARVLIVVDRADTLTSLSLRNHDSAVILTFDQLNTYDVLKADDLIFTQAAFDAFVAARSTEGAETVSLSAHATEVSKNDQAPAAPKKAAAKKAPAKKAPAKKAAAETVETEAPAADAGEGSIVPANATATQPYGAGSKAPLKSGNAPKGHELKGAGGHYYTDADAGFADVDAEVWFDSAETAEAAGFTKAGA